MNASVSWKASDSRQERKDCTGAPVDFRQLGKLAESHCRACNALGLARSTSFDLACAGARARLRVPPRAPYVCARCASSTNVVETIRGERVTRIRIRETGISRAPSLLRSRRHRHTTARNSTPGVVGQEQGSTSHECVRARLCCSLDLRCSTLSMSRCRVALQGVSSEDPTPPRGQSRCVIFTTPWKPFDIFVLVARRRALRRRADRGEGVANPQHAPSGLGPFLFLTYNSSERSSRPLY
jgi:hypothetical protein